MRILDLVLSTFALLILLPIILVSLFLVLLQDGRNPFFIQLRRGKEGCFSIVKLRTMSCEADVASRRITFIGRFLRILSIDELPQLLNVLKGDMSLVGVRPDLCEVDKPFLKQRPGLTGLAQIAGRSNISEVDRDRLNSYWEENASLMLYFRVIFRTVIYIISLNFFFDAN